MPGHERDRRSSAGQPISWTMQASDRHVRASARSSGRSRFDTSDSSKSTPSRASAFSRASLPSSAVDGMREGFSDRSTSDDADGANSSRVDPLGMRDVVHALGLCVSLPTSV